MSKAQIQKPSPSFQGIAVNPQGQFVDVKLSDYKGMSAAAFYLLFYWRNKVTRRFLRFIFSGKYCVLFFYPLDL